MKKILSLLAMVFLLIACGDKQTNDNVLYLYGWADYIPKEIYDEF